MLTLLWLQRGHIAVEVMRISAHTLIHALDVDLEADIVCFKLYHQHGTFFIKNTFVIGKCFRSRNERAQVASAAEGAHSPGDMCLIPSLRG
jgi:hypothetical protein